MITTLFPMSWPEFQFFLLSTSKQVCNWWHLIFIKQNIEFWVLSVKSKAH